ncbi:uncharacterized protein MELLADRAFT_117785 [Melampsora larici-populina 98AG31]|uniref:BTB domain-containing protein n=1 Tax=Melampsora larici-populina (strain 98AG31 / pathotype 3-4-7) TaxID=747676 RepID=F4S1J4_MELLP|nr:uncharacterized protein MELLADRAFT_117785 [Melampsora larici-populina 98AG31]EGG01494.1 hypothetical protein MELLADRAFT_117785 [Melampsora larici-populina 98AG31]
MTTSSSNRIHHPTQSPTTISSNYQAKISQQPSGTLADLTACVRSTKGDIPPPLVGASITVLGTGLYVFGGRLVPTRLMVSDLYRLDLQSLHWEKIWPSSDSSHNSIDFKGKGRAINPHQTSTLNRKSSSETSIPNSQDLDATTHQIPRARYFHSAEAWDHKLIIFGGMGYANNMLDDQQRPVTPDLNSDTEVGLCVLDDVLVFDTITRTWSFPSTTAAPTITPPSPRYAHLSCLTSESGYSGPVTEDDYIEFATSSKPQSTPRILKPNKRPSRNLLTLMGGQDISNRYIGEINVLDLDSMQWIEGRRWERHCGTYRSVACTSRLSVRQGDRFDSTDDSNPDQVLRRLNWSEKPSVERPEPVYLYSNFNFNDVRRDLELISYPTTPPPPPATPTLTGHYTTIHPLSHSMTGVLPNGLRFPTGTMIGTHLIVSGTSLNTEKVPDQLDCFAIWALDLSQSNHKHIPVKVPNGARPEVSTHNNTQFGSGKVVWQRIDPGRIMMSGSWNRAVGWGNCLVVLGDKDRDIVNDYHHRQINFVDLAFIDLEAFAIYQPPFSTQSHVRRGLPRDASLKVAKSNLSLLRNVHLTDFEIACADGHLIPVNKKLLEDRWPWFRKELDAFKLQATKTHVSYQQQMRVACLAKRRSQSELDQATGGGHHQENGKGGASKSIKNVIFRNRASTVQSNRPRHLSMAFNSSKTNIDPTHSNSLNSLIPNLKLPELHQITPRRLHLPHPVILVQAFLEYIYTLELLTPLHHSPAILGSLLVFATTYKIDHLRMLTVHGLHRYLNPAHLAYPNGTKSSGSSTSSIGNAVGLIYEAATLSGCMALQIRSLKAIIANQHKHFSNTRALHSSGSNVSTHTTGTVGSGRTSSMATINSYGTNSTSGNGVGGGGSVIFDHHSGISRAQQHGYLQNGNGIENSGLGGRSCARPVTSGGFN